MLCAGAMYACQIYRAAEKDLPSLAEEIAAGRFAPLRAWLKEKIHKVRRPCALGLFQASKRAPCPCACVTLRSRPLHVAYAEGGCYNCVVCCKPCKLVVNPWLGLTFARKEQNATRWLAVVRLSERGIASKPPAAK